jgi:hypothetical protein
MTRFVERWHAHFGKVCPSREMRTFDHLQKFKFMLGAQGAGLPDGIFSKPKNTKLGKFWRVLQWQVSAYFMDIRYIL